MANKTTTSMQFSANLPIFKGESYKRWVRQMKVVFKFQDVSKIMSDGVPTLKANANDEQKVAHKDKKKKDGKTLFLIHWCVDTNVFE